MKIVQPKNESVLVEMSYTELKELTADRIWRYDDALQFCRSSKEIHIGEWAKEFKQTTKYKIKELKETIKAMESFFNNRIEVLELFEKDMK